MRYVVIALVLITFNACKGQSITKTEIITLEDFKKEVIGKNVQLIDVRTKREYISGHIDNAILIPIANKEYFITEVQKLDKNKPVYMYCHTGVRSKKASNILEGIGFLKIYDFTGGWNVWSKQ